MRSPRFSCLSALVCLSLVLGAGCSDDDSSGENNNNTTSDAGVDAAPDAATGESLELIMLDGTDPDMTSDMAPRLEGVMVAFDLPGGERVERSSGPDGHVLVYGVDWSLGTLSITSYLDGYRMISHVDMDADILDPSSPWVIIEEGAIVVYLQDLSPTDPAEISVTGTATHMEDPSHDYLAYAVGTTATSQWSGSGSSGFDCVGPADTPFTLLGVEVTEHGILPSGQGNDMDVHRAMALEMPASAGPAVNVELDFLGDQIPIYTADASIVLPPRADSPLRDAMPYLFVGSAGGMYTMGWGTPVDISADGNRFEGTVSWLEPPGVTDPFIFFAVVQQATLARSVAMDDGYPTGLPIAPIYDLPRWITPSDSTTYYPLHDPIEWELFDDWEVVMLRISRSGIDIWNVRCPANATSVTVPRPPSTVDVNSFLGPSFRAQLVGGWIEPEADHFDRYVESPYIRLSRE